VFTDLFDSRYWPFILAVIAALALITFMLVSAIFSVWLERKVAGRIQDRLGPTRVGGKFGWLQTIADGIKLLTKEDLIPASADSMLFRLGPYIAFCGAFGAFIALPFADGWVAKPMSIAVFFMLAVMSTEVFGIILAGYGSGSKWSLFGGMREAAQMVSYEVPMAICVLVPVIVAGELAGILACAERTRPRHYDGDDVTSALALAAQFRRDERWRPLSRRSALIGLLALASSFAFLVSFANVFFWIYLALVLGWLMLIARRALALA